jgi:hypothetical protein
MPYPDPPVDIKSKEFCRVLHLLHIPFREFPPAETPWVATIQNARDLLPAWRNAQINAASREDTDGDDEDEDEDEDENMGSILNDGVVCDGERLPDEEWQNAARLGYNEDELASADGMVLGARNIDLNHDWIADLDQLGGFDQLIHNGAIEWIQDHRSSGSRPNDLLYIDPALLNRDQQHVFDLIMEHHHNQDPEPIRLIVSGTAGSGKSFLLNCLRYQLSRERGASEYCPVAAYTGVAAFNVNGLTLHSLFRLGLRGVDPELEPQQVERLQERLQHLRYLFIDEKSMIGANTLSRIHNRLSIAFPAYADVPFGGRSIILIGDFAQLPPIGEIPMYATAPRFPKIPTLQGIALYAQFDRFVRLRINMRQGGNDQSTFRDILLRARNGDWSEDDWQVLFNRRAFCNLSRPIMDEFIHATYLFPTNDAVNRFNRDNLERLGRPVAKIDARNTGQPARSILEAVSSDMACGLQQLLQLSIGARVMLRKNLWTDMGLVNGALGM